MQMQIEVLRVEVRRGIARASQKPYQMAELQQVTRACAVPSAATDGAAACPAV